MLNPASYLHHKRILDCCASAFGHIGVRLYGLFGDGVPPDPARSPRRGGATARGSAQRGERQDGASACEFGGSPEGFDYDFRRAGDCSLVTPWVNGWVTTLSLSPTNDGYNSVFQPGFNVADSLARCCLALLGAARCFSVWLGWAVERRV